MSPALLHAIGQTVVGLAVAGMALALVNVSTRVRLLTEVVRTLARAQQDLTATLLDAAKAADRYRDERRHG